MVQFGRAFVPILLLLSSLCPFGGAELKKKEEEGEGKGKCANGGTFLGRYCLADYNCKGRRGRQRQMFSSTSSCIRGLCCSRTRVPAKSVNVRRREDIECPRGSFSVGLRCRNTRQCLLLLEEGDSSTEDEQFELPLLECSKGRMCCTNSRYRKPLRRGERCLNGGIALGGRECRRAEECRRPNGREEEVGCVDGQCCARRKNIRWDEGDDGDEEDEEMDAERDEDGEDGRMMTGAADADEEEDEGEGSGDSGRDLLEGSHICGRRGLRYSRVRRCLLSPNCGDSARFRCIRGHCCELSLSDEYGRDEDEAETAEAYEEDKVGRKEDEQNEDEEDAELDENIPSSEAGASHRWRVPAGPAGFCVGGDRAFRQFMGHLCTAKADCPWALDSSGRQIPVQCLRGACCGALSGRGRGRKRKRKELTEDDNKGRDEEGVEHPLIPIRSQKAFCYDGSQSGRQCLSSLDCASGQICVNLLCCPMGGDAQQYACGGLQSTSQCALPGGMSSFCPANGLHCISPKACCECRYGQSQPGVKDCQRRNDSCLKGYHCDSSTGFCCPHCADGEIPFGSCNRGRCAPEGTFKCVPGNICCPRVTNWDALN